MSTNRIVVFDDSSDALKRYADVFAEADCDFFKFKSPEISAEVRAALTVLDPDLIIVDLVMGESRKDGYRLIAQLREIPFKGRVPPIVVCSKLITSSSMGRAEKETALEEPGVVAAFGKFPDLPVAEKFLEHARKFSSGPNMAKAG
jgi:CheY-like chemotaxis protein